MTESDKHGSIGCLLLFAFLVVMGSAIVTANLWLVVATIATTILVSCMWAYNAPDQQETPDGQLLKMLAEHYKPILDKTTVLAGDWWRAADAGGRRVFITRISGGWLVSLDTIFEPQWKTYVEDK